MAKRAKFALLLFTVLTIAWLVWSHIAHQRLQAKIDDLKARHEPVYYSDLDFSPIPDKENSAFYYQSAIAAMSNTVWPPAASNFTFPGYPPYPAMWHSMVDQAVAANRQSLVLARRASKFDRADWGTRPPQSPQFRTPLRFGYFNGARALANLLGDGALQSHSHGDDAEALQRIFDLLHLADAVEQRGLLIGRLVGIGIQSLAIDRIEVMATDLRTNPNRTEVIKLIHLLLDEHKYLDARQSMAEYESVSVLEDTLALASDATILRPMINLSVCRTLDRDERFQLALKQRTWPAVEAIYGQPISFGSLVAANPPVQAPRLSRLGDIYFNLSNTGVYLMIEFRMSAEFRMAATSLAVNLYRADRNRWPSDLNSLVPNYLPFVPDDPFYAIPHPIGYIVLNNSRPMLFCDSNGASSTSSPPAQPSFSWSNATGTRQWRDITHWWQSPTQK